MKIAYCLMASALVCLSFASCNNENKASPLVKEKKTVDKKADGVYKVDYNATTKDWMTWYKYTYHNIRLAQDFTALDADSTAITKALFLKKLATGNFITLKVAQQNRVPSYKLYPLTGNQPDINNTIKQMAETARGLAAYEGKELPDYSFTDLAGTVYNKQNTKGKFLLIKCWFINCVACVKEFPELNALVDKYKGREDVAFISLASDPKKNLQDFVQKKPFKYAVVPGTKGYMNDKLGIMAYPTHFLVDKNGIVLKATNDIEDLLPTIEKVL